MFDCFACGTSYSSEDGVIDHENVEYYSAQYKAEKNISGAEENLPDYDFIRDEERNK